MKTYSIIGGAVSPSAVVIARTAKQAKRLYNDWLERSYGRRDEGVGVDLLDPKLVCVHDGGLFCYPPGVKGHTDPKFAQRVKLRTALKPLLLTDDGFFLGDYEPGTSISALIPDFDEHTGWSQEQLAWFKKHVGKIVRGKVEELSGSNYFRPNRAPLLLTDDEIVIHR